MKTKHPIAILALLAFFAIQPLRINAQVPFYTVIDLGALQGNESHGYGINGAGDVVGDYGKGISNYDDALYGNFYPYEMRHAFLFKSGTMHDLGTLGGPGSAALAVNDSDQVTGWAYLSGSTSYTAFLYTSGTMTNLGVGNSGIGASVNNAGQVAGLGLDISGIGYGFIYSSGSSTLLENENVFAINDGGLYAGGYNGGDAFLAYSGTTKGLGALIPGNFNSYSLGLALNSAGTVVGQSGLFDIGSRAFGYNHAFLYTSGTMYDLSIPLNNYHGDSGARAINNSNCVTGYFTPDGLPGANENHTLDTNKNHAFLYVSGTGYDLNHLIVPDGMADFEVLSQGNAINDSGWITGWGVTRNGETHAFLATPAKPALGSLVAAQGDLIFAHGIYAVLDGAGSPAIDDAGEVAFRASTIGPLIPPKKNSAILLYSSTGATVIAVTGGADANTYSTFTKLSDPALSGSGALAFIGSTQPGKGVVTSANDTGVYLYQSGSTWLVAQTGSNQFLFGNGFYFASFDQIAVSDRFLGEIMISSRISDNAYDGSGNDVALVKSLRISGGGFGYHILVVKGNPDSYGDSFAALTALPFVSGQSRSLDTVNGGTSFLVSSPNVPLMSVEESYPGNSSWSISVGGTSAGLASNVFVHSLREPAVNANGTIALSLTLAGGVKSTNKSAIALFSGFNTSSYGYIRTGDPAPDANGLKTSGAVFSTLSDSVLNNHDHIAFVARVSGTGVNSSNSVGVWSDADGTLRQIARKGETAPGSKGKFATFNQIVLPDVRGVVMLATLSGVPAVESQGVWVAQSDGTLLPVVKKGDTLDFHGVTKAIKEIGIFQVAPAAQGQSRSFDATTGNLVYKATFTDGTWGIYEVMFP